MIASLTSTVQRFNPRFWVLVGARFVDSLGSSMVFPFFSLYITDKFDVGMTEAGVMLGIFSISSFVGGLIGGALADRFGRRTIILFGVLASALTSIAFGVVNEYSVFYVLAAVVGLPSAMADPAYSAMVADILPEEQRGEGYGILTVSHNLSWMIGPAVGGFLIGHSFLYIFIADAAASLIVAGIFYKMIPETQPERKDGETSEPIIKTFLGYFKVAKDKLFLGFSFSMLMIRFAYRQLNTALPVFLRDFHGISGRNYAYLWTANAFLIVIAQFWVSSKIRKKQPLLMIALSAFFYIIGYLLIGLVSSYVWFLAAILIITVGEMVGVPVTQALTAKLSPDQMRARYMAFHSLTWMIPGALGPGLGGLIMDNTNPDLVWYFCVVFCLVAIGMFLLLRKPVNRRTSAPESVAG